MGVKAFPLIAIALLMGGCAAQSPPPSAPAADPVAERHYAPAAASALAFSSPLAPPYELAGLDRDARTAGAFIGYEDGVTESFASGMTDVQSNDPSQTNYFRWSASEKVGVRYR